MTDDDITAHLFDLQDVSYRTFQAKLIPSVAPESIIGVRTPALRAFAKQLAKEENANSFLCALPHHYFDENQLHAFLINEEKDFNACLAKVERFLPFVDNWATCDQLLPKAFKKRPEQLVPCIPQWLSSQETYTVRFAIGQLMQHFLDERFDTTYLIWVSDVHSEAYYVRMMVAWYVATALAKQYNATLPLLEQQRLDPWTHNKAIQKALESYRITVEQKQELRALKLPVPPQKSARS